MHAPADTELQDAAVRFRVPGRYLGAEPYGNGHINDTFAAWWERGNRRERILLQRINGRVFRNPPEMMANIIRVTGHLRNRLAVLPDADPDRESLTLIPTRDDTAFHRDGGGHYWRAYVFIEDALTRDICETPAQAFEAARAFGRFQRMLADLPGDPLHETIPYFHHTPRRFAALRRAIARDPVNRAAGAAAEIDFALAREPEAAAVTGRLDSGELPWRITHNDTKLNNVMLDVRTGRGVCVIDLDTVMPGSCLYDFGDLVRTCANATAEDRPDPGRDIFRPDVFEALARGYIEEAGGFLTRSEIETLAMSGRLMTMTIGIRFLTDYLEGDRYFKTHRAGQNLDRARVQLQLAHWMERHAAAMQKAVLDSARAGGN